jgi:hypothetical protein
MAKPETETELLRVVAGAFPQSADRLRGQVEILAALTNLQNDRIRENTDAVTQNTSARGSGSSPIVTVGRTILNTIGGGLFLSPLVNGIARLFRGTRPDEEPAPAAASRATPRNIEAAVLPDGGAAPFDFDQYGKPRPVDPARVTLAALDNSGFRPNTLNNLQDFPGSGSGKSGFRPNILDYLQAQEEFPGPGSGKSGFRPNILDNLRGTGEQGTAYQEAVRASGQTNVTIQIQALDSRSILDRSDEIARALREAMLNSHAVNDLIREG